ncbi:hypothetical protein AGMMS49525_18450 [Bacteroidia bacterium]|nr:hypothetical protein AGMMS49525_18450 [Bacteroidia bacterium]
MPTNGQWQTLLDNFVSLSGGPGTLGSTLELQSVWNSGDALAGYYDHYGPSGYWNGWDSRTTFIVYDPSGGTSDSGDTAWFNPPPYMIGGWGVGPSAFPVRCVRSM